MTLPIQTVTDGVSRAKQLEALRHEYTEAALSLRHYSALRFVMFSIYVAIVAALGGVALGIVGSNRPSTTLVRIACFGAVLVTYVFFTCEVSCQRDRHHFRRIMQTLEPGLAYSSMTTAPRDTLLKPAVAFRALFLANFIFWVVLCFRGGL